jgi:hypothetical protein
MLRYVWWLACYDNSNSNIPVQANLNLFALGELGNRYCLHHFL